VAWEAVVAEAVVEVAFGAAASSYLHPAFYSCDGG